MTTDLSADDRDNPEIHHPAAHETYRARFEGGPHGDTVSIRTSEYGGVEDRIARDIEDATRTAWYTCTGKADQVADRTTWNYNYDETRTHEA